MVEDSELIRQYVSNHSEHAFAEVVSRHLKMVYAAALRWTNGDCQLAEEIAQSVFVDLAGKAGKLQGRISLAGWLYASTRFAAANAVRAEYRRRAREQMAVTMNEIHSKAGTHWDEYRPVIEEMLAHLAGAERDAIVLRFFETLEYPQVGAALGISESGARMRVERGLEKLRALLQRRGIGTTNEALAGALAAPAAIELPAHLAAEITKAAISHAATGAGASTVLKILTMKKIAFISASLFLLLSVGTLAVKHMLRPPNPGFKVVQAKVHAVLAPGETLMTGGWTIQKGQRVFVFITPQWIDPKGNRLPAPRGADPQMMLQGRFVEGSEAEFSKLGLKPGFVAHESSDVAVKYSAADFKSLLAAFQNGDGADILSSPRITTAAGVQASVAVVENQIIGGKPVPIGPKLDLLANVSKDGISMDLVATATITERTGP